MPSDPEPITLDYAAADKPARPWVRAYSKSLAWAIGPLVANTAVFIVYVATHWSQMMAVVIPMVAMESVVFVAGLACWVDELMSDARWFGVSRPNPYLRACLPLLLLVANAPAAYYYFKIAWA